jgi:hypothetical protein
MRTAALRRSTDASSSRNRRGPRPGRSAGLNENAPRRVATVTVAEAGASSVRASVAPCAAACFFFANACLFLAWAFLFLAWAFLFLAAAFLAGMVPTLNRVPSTSASGRERSTSIATTRPSDTWISPSHSARVASLSPRRSSRPMRPGGISTAAPGLGPLLAGEPWASAASSSSCAALGTATR